jgi:hypothetical protein
MDEEILLEQEAAEEIAEATDSGDFEPGRRRRERKGIRGTFSRARAYRGQATAAFIVLAGA